MTAKQAEKEKIRLQNLVNDIYYISSSKADEYYFKLLGMIEVLSTIQRNQNLIYTDNIELFIWKNK